MRALRGKWMIYGLRGWGICGGYNLQVGYIGANLEAVFVQVESAWGLMWAKVRYEG